MRYQDVAFADGNGHEVVFESSGVGKWYGPKDFSTSFQLAWDEGFLYLAIDVTDDVFQAGARTHGYKRYCWKTGLQLGFEVGGPTSDEEGMLQALRSTNPDVSMLNLLNVGLFPGQLGCLTASSVLDHGYSPDSVEGRECCVEYVAHHGEGWARTSKFAVLRNDNNNHTVFEAAISKLDLIGSSAGRHEQWKQGLQFGFSMAVNDGD
eukprot:2532846-Prymnesium_polylepis.2